MLAQSEAVEPGWRMWARRAAIALVGTALAITLAGGFLHTKAGRPYMARIFGAACPMNQVSATDLDAARRGVVNPLRGTVPAPKRPAFVFALDETTASDVKAWALRAGVDCAQEKPWLVKCSQVPASALGRPDNQGAVEELALGFSANDRLVNLTTLRRHLSPDDGARVVRSIADDLASELGRSNAQMAGISGQVSHDPLSSMRLSLSFSDYLAEVTAMNLPSSGVAVREHYLSARD